MPESSNPHAIVVGAGVVGLFCAYYLRLAGATVTVLDRGEVGGEQSCSARNTGFVGTQGAAPLAEPGVLTQGIRWLASQQSPLAIRPRPSPQLARWLWHFRKLCNDADAAACFATLLDLKRRSLDILREVCATGDLATSFTNHGMIVAFKTEQGFDKACRSVPAAVERGVPLAVLGSGELRELAPDVEFDVHGALFNAEGAALEVPRFLTAFARVLEAMDVRFVPRAQVTGFNVASNGGGGRQIRGVRTTSGDFTADEVVLAAGAWSARCAALLDVRLMLQPAKGYTVTIATPPAAPKLPVLLSEGKVALMPLGDKIRFGGTLELAGLSTSVSRKRVDGIVATVRSYLPGLAIDADSIDTGQQVWSGLRPCTPDSLPYLGRVRPYVNLSVACGHGYIGMGLAPATGKLIAQIIAGQPPDIDPAPFRVGRFGGA